MQRNAYKRGQAQKSSDSVVKESSPSLSWHKNKTCSVQNWGRPWLAGQPTRPGTVVFGGVIGLAARDTTSAGAWIFIWAGGRGAGAGGGGCRGGCGCSGGGSGGCGDCSGGGSGAWLLCLQLRWLWGKGW